MSCGAIRHQGDLAGRSLQEAREAEQARSVSWWYFAENSRFGLSAELPAAQGVVAKTLERLAEQLPVMPGEEDGWGADARRADALVALCSARIASDPDPDRATVVVHARVDNRSVDLGGCEIEGGPAIHPQTVRRLACTGRIQTVLEDGAGRVVGLGRITRDPPEWMRQLKYRDRECTFHGCGARRFIQAHHVTSFGGSTGAGPTWTTWSWCAHSTTGWSTSTGGASSGIGTARSGGSTPTGPATVPDRRRLAGPLSKKSPYLPRRLDHRGVLIEQHQSQADQRPRPAALASPSARENWAARRVSGGTGSARA